MKHIQRNVQDIYTVSEESVLSALRLVWERMKQIIEPSAAVSLAVVLDSEDFAQLVHRRVSSKRQQMGWNSEHVVEVRVGVVWTGGNVELDSIVTALQQQGKAQS
jgi:threonine dehydratase